MKTNKLLVLAILAIFTVAIAGSASAFDLSSLLSGDSDADSDQLVTIEGIDFNIPAGYEENENYTFVNETQQSGSVSYVMNGKTYEKGNDAIAIIIADYGKYNVTDDIISQVADDKKTINGYNGYITVDNDFTVFAFEEKGDLVTVTVSDQDLLEQILVEQ